MLNFFRRAFGKFIRVWQSSDKIGHQIVRSGTILFLGRIVLRAIQFGKTVIVARLLFPEDFGLFGLATISLGLIDVFLQTGFNSALIKEKGDVTKYLDSVWSFGVLRNFVLAFVIYFTAPLFASFFNNDLVIPLIQALSVVVFINGFESPGIVLLQKELRFNKKFWFDISIVVVEVTTTIIAAFVLRSVWALVIGTFANKIAGNIFSYVYHSYRPKFRIDSSDIKVLFSYGKWVSLTAIVGYFVTQGDNLVIGKMLAPHELGYYQLAFALGLLPAVEVGRVLGTLLFPMFSKIQDDPEFLRRSFIKTGRLIFAAAIPASFGLLCLSHEIVEGFYGEKWIPMIPALIVVSLYGLVKTFEYMVTPYFQGIGKANVPAMSSVIQLSIMAISIVPLTSRFGIKGAAAAVLFGAVASQIFLFFRVRKSLNLGISGITEIFSVPVLASGLMYLALFATKEFLGNQGLWLTVVLIVYGAFLYIGFLFILDRLLGRKIYDSLSWIFKRI